MEKIIIDELSKEALYHFDYVKSIEKIEQEGLTAAIGENAKGIEKTPKVFFSKGELGIIKATEVWLRWLMNRIYGINDRLNIFKNLSAQENEERLLKWTEEFLSGEYKNDEKKKEKLFEYFFNYLQKRTYFVLDITEGKEYKANDIDENKEKMIKNKNNIDNLFAKTMYGEFSNIDSPIMDDWNMHTKTNIGIEKDKIKQVTTPTGNTDMLSLILHIYDKNKDIQHPHFLLDDFVEYTKRKQEINNMVSEEGIKNDQINHSRFY